MREKASNRMVYNFCDSPFSFNTGEFYQKKKNSYDLVVIEI